MNNKYVFKKKERKKIEGAPDYMVTYGDLMSLLLTFFIMLLSVAKIEGQELKLILANFPGLGNMLGGLSFNEGKLPKSGQVENALPSKQRGFALDKFQSKAVQIFQDQVRNNQIRITITERGLVISISSDTYFEKFSANLNLEENFSSLRNLASLMRDFLLTNPNTPIKIEGYTDENTLPIGSPYDDEWGLSAARSLSMLRFFEQFLVPLNNAQVSGYGNTRMIMEDETSGDGIGNSYNRRVDIIILNEGNL